MQRFALVQHAQPLRCCSHIHMRVRQQRPAFACQRGGFIPRSQKPLNTFVGDGAALRRREDYDHTRCQQQTAPCKTLACPPPQVAIANTPSR